MRRATFCFAIVLPVAPPAMAQDVGEINYDQVFIEHADRVVMLSDTGDAARFQVELPGNVTIWADVTGEMRRYSAMDNNPGGSVGCLWNAYNDLAVLNQSCPGVLTEEEAGRLEVYRQRVGDFVADNTVPPVRRDAFWAAWSDMAIPDAGMECAAIMGSETGPLISTLVSAEVASVLDNVLSVPRLPVETPCF